MRFLELLYCSLRSGPHVRVDLMYCSLLRTLVWYFDRYSIVLNRMYQGDRKKHELIRINVKDLA